VYKTMKRIVCIGDSLTYGFGVYPEASFPYILGEMLHTECINKGVCGDCTSGMAARFYEDVTALKPDIVVITGGSNDILNGWPLQQTLEFMHEMTDTALRGGAAVFAGIPMCIDAAEMAADGFPVQMAERMVAKFKAYKEALVRLCEEKSGGSSDSRPVRYIDFQSEYPRMMRLSGKRYWFADGLHPTKEGYYVMAEIAAEYIKKSGIIQL